MKTPCRVDYHRVKSLHLRLGHCLPGNVGRGCALLGRKVWTVDLAGQGLKLFYGCRAVYVCRHKEGFSALFAKPSCKFRRSCGLTRALEPYKYDDCRLTSSQIKSFSLCAKKPYELLVDNLYNLLARGEAFHYLVPQGPLLHPLYKVLYYLVVDIGLKKGKTHLPEPLVDVFLGKGSLAL